jgi:hypothetical protein
LPGIRNNASARFSAGRTHPWATIDAQTIIKREKALESGGYLPGLSASSHVSFPVQNMTLNIISMRHACN